MATKQTIRIAASDISKTDANITIQAREVIMPEDPPTTGKTRQVLCSEAYGDAVPLGLPEGTQDYQIPVWYSGAWHLLNLGANHMVLQNNNGVLEYGPVRAYTP
jgi:hypothetical protein